MWFLVRKKKYTGSVQMATPGNQPSHPAPVPAKADVPSVTPESYPCGILHNLWILRLFKSGIPQKICRWSRIMWQASQIKNSGGNAKEGMNGKVLPTIFIGFLLQRLDGISERRAFPPKRGAGPETAVPSGASAAGTAQGQGSGVLHQNCIIYARTVRRGKQQQNGYRFLKIFERFGRGPFTG